MDSLYELISSKYRVWDPCEFQDTDTIDVTEIWVHSTTQRKITRHRKVPSHDVDAWLIHNLETIDDQDFSIVLRIVWVKIQHVEKIKHIALKTQDRILSGFGIQLAHDWNWTCFAGLKRFAETEGPHGRSSSYAICNHPKMATAWSHNSSIGLTQGIHFAAPGQIGELQSLVQSLMNIANHPMLPSLVFGTSLSALVEEENKKIKEKVRAVEVRTQFHSWASRNESPAQGDYMSLSAMTTGAKTRLANSCRRATILHELCDFIRGGLPDSSKSSSHRLGQAGSDTETKLIEEYTNLLEKRTILQEADVKFFQHRADVQLVSVSHNGPRAFY